MQTLNQPAFGNQEQAIGLIIDQRVERAAGGDTTDGCSVGDVQDVDRAVAIDAVDVRLADRSELRDSGRHPLRQAGAGVDAMEHRLLGRDEQSIGHGSRRAVGGKTGHIPPDERALQFVHRVELTGQRDYVD